MITYDYFAKLELRVATIITAKRVTGSEKLLKLQVNLGSQSSEETREERQIIAGIGKNYQPEDLLGRQIIIIVNLEPRSLLGLESQGMLLAADTPHGPVIITLDQEVAAGAKIK